MVTTAGAASISTSSVSPATCNSGLASRIPLELPILPSFPRTTAISRQRAHMVATLESAVLAGDHRQDEAIPHTAVPRRFGLSIRWAQIPVVPQEARIARTRCSCGLMPRTRLKAALSANGVL